MLVAETLAPYPPLNRSHSIPQITILAQGRSRSEERQSVASTTSHRDVNLLSLHLRRHHWWPTGIPPLCSHRLSSPPPRAYHPPIPLLAGSTLLHRLRHKLKLIHSSIPCICGRPSASSRFIIHGDRILPSSPYTPSLVCYVRLPSIILLYYLHL